MTCNQAVCGDCATLGSHNGHKFGDFKAGFEKVVNEMVPVMKICQTEGESLMAEIENLLGNGISKSKEMLVNIKKKLDRLRKIIDEKECEMSNAVKKLIAEKSKKLNEIHEIHAKIVKTISECSQEITRKDKINCELYDELLGKVYDLLDAKKSYQKYLSMRGEKLGLFEVPSFGHVEEMADEISKEFAAMPEKKAYTVQKQVNEEKGGGLLRLHGLRNHEDNEKINTQLAYKILQKEENICKTYNNPMIPQFKYNQYLKDNEH